MKGFKKYSKFILYKLQ